MTAFQPELTDNIYWPWPTGAYIVEMEIGDNDFGYVPDGGECTSSGYCNLPDIPGGGVMEVWANVYIEPDMDTDLTGQLLDQRVCVDADNTATYACTRFEGEIQSQTGLRIEKDDLGEAIVAGGQPLQYVITVWNSGPSDAYGVTIDDIPLLPGLSLWGDLVPGDRPMFCVDDSCIIPILRADESVEIYATVVADPTTAVGPDQDANEACIVGVNYVNDWILPPLPTCVTETTDVLVEADLAIDKRGPLTVTASATFAYTITVWNNRAVGCDGRDGDGYAALRRELCERAASPSCAASGGLVTCGTVRPGGVEQPGDRAGW